jgi:hypothetical protein
MGSVRAIVLSLLVVCVVVPAETTHAQFLFWPRHGFWWSDHTTRWHEHRYRRTKPEFAEKDEAQDAPSGVARWLQPDIMPAVARAFRYRSVRATVEVAGAPR